MTDDSRARRCKCAYPDDPNCPVHGDSVIPEEALTTAEAAMRGHDCHEVVNTNIPHLARAALLAALPHLRAHQIEGAGVAEAREALIREFSGLIDADAYVADMPAWLRAFGERLLGLPILTPEEAETKALAETATEVGRRLGRKEAADQIAHLHKPLPPPKRQEWCPECQTLWPCATVIACRDLAKGTS